jgi:hypothetical protein
MSSPFDIVYRAVKFRQGAKVWYGVQHWDQLESAWVDNTWPKFDTLDEVHAFVKQTNVPSDEIISTVLKD